jgi:hypothetical protein
MKEVLGRKMLLYVMMSPDLYASLDEVQKQLFLVYISFCPCIDPVIVSLRTFLLKVVQLQHPQAKNLVEQEGLTKLLMRSLVRHPMIKIFHKENEEDTRSYVSLYTTTQKQFNTAHSYSY